MRRANLTRKNKMLRNLSPDECDTNDGIKFLSHQVHRSHSTIYNVQDYMPGLGLV